MNRQYRLNKSRASFYLPPTIKDSGKPNLVDKLRFQPAYINLKKTVERHRKMQSLLFDMWWSVQALILIIWIYVDLDLPTLCSPEESCLSRTLKENLILFPLFYLLFAGGIFAIKYLLMRRNNYRELMLSLTSSSEAALKDIYIQYVKAKVAYDIMDNDNTSDLAPSEPAHFGLKAKMPKSSMTYNEILMQGTYFFGERAVLLSLILSFNEDYSALMVVDHNLDITFIKEAS